MCVNNKIAILIASSVIFFSKNVLSDQTDFSTVNLGVDLEYSDNQNDSTSTSDTYGSLESNIYFSDYDITLIPFAGFLTSDEVVLDREDKTSLSLRGFYTFNGGRFYPEPWESSPGLSLGLGVWKEDTSISDDDRDTKGVDAILSYKIGKGLLNNTIVRGTYSEMNPDSENDPENGWLTEIEYSKVHYFEDEWLGFHGLEINPRLSYGSFDIESDTKSSERLLSGQARFRLFRNLNESGSLFLNFEVMIGHDELSNFRGGEDLDSDYARAGINFTYVINPEGTDGTGGSSGGRWKRP